MRFLILSDIHSNIQGLRAVLASAEGGYDQVVCLGDIVGYGGSPNEVTEWVRTNVTAVVRGNHDRACTGDGVIQEFNENAMMAALWTLAELEQDHARYIANLPKGPVAVDAFFAVHGSPRDEDEYVMTKADAIRCYDVMPGNICFFGHTHVQMGIGMRRNRAWLLMAPEDDEAERVYELENNTWYLLNPGSVGQPRDGDPRAAYAIYDSNNRLLAMRRTEYDVMAAQRAIVDANLPRHLADRLAGGR